MLNNRDIVVFSDDWGRHPSSCQHLVKELLLFNRVIWVNTIGMRSPRFSINDLKRSIEVVGGWLQKKGESEYDEMPENLTVVSPVMIPYNNIPLVRRFNRISIRRTLRSLIEKQGMKDVLVMSTFPCTCDSVGDFDESIYIYYCVDDFVNWPDVDLKMVDAMEAKLLSRCDLVLATSEELCKSKCVPDKLTHLLPHGVEYERFRVTRDQTMKPAAIQKFKKPVIGFFGALSAWLDFELIVHIATSRPEWSFVFIGPADTDISPIKGIPNIILVGKVPYEQLPYYAAWFDVGIIPFQVNELTRSVNPLKLLEYLSLGLPVVSTFMPELLKYTDIVSIPRNYEEFLKALDTALEDDNQSKHQQRVERARRNSWKVVAERFGEFVLQTESAKAVMTPKRDGAW